MRHFAALLSAVLVCSSAPSPAWAQFARTAAPVRGPVVPTAPAALALPKIASPGLSPTLGLSPLPSASALPTAAIPTLSPSITPTAPAALPLARQRAEVRAASVLSPVPAAPAAETLPKRLERLTEGAAGDLKVLPAAGASESRGAAETGFNRLLGAPSARPIAASDYDAAPAPRSFFRGGLRPAAANAAAEAAPQPTPAPATASKGDVRTYLLGTAALKVGIEALGLAVPLIALVVFGQAKWAAVMAMGWGLAQIVGSSVAGGILDRKPPAKVLSRALLFQAIAVGTLISLFLAQAATGIAFAQPIAIFALHFAIGIMASIADTARQVIPPAVVGNDGQDLKVFNSKVHIVYEVAAVVGALVTGVVIKTFGLVPALLIHPPMFLLAAWLFSRLKLAPAGSPVGLLEGTFLDKAKALVGTAWSDLKAGAAAVRGSRVVFWAAVALVVPLTIHRLLETLLIPVAAKALIGDPATAAWIMAASSFGELLGAFWLMRANRDETQPAKLRSPFWIRLMAMGILGTWVFSVAPNLWFILPVMAFRAMSWAASDLSLRSKIQESLPPDLRGRTFGFLTATTFAMVLLISAALGLAFDSFTASPVFWALNAGISLAVVGLLFAAARLAKTYPKQQP